MKRLVILGSGFAGLEAAFALERAFRRSPDREVLLVSEHNYFLFTPLLPQIPSSYINPRHIVQTVRDIRGKRRFRFIRDSAWAIDPARREVLLGSGPLSYDYLVVALGSRSDDFGIPGVRECSFDFKSLEDAVNIRERVLDLCEHADHSTDPAERARLLRFVVVGGGYTGVELISELRDFLFRYVVGKYRGIAWTDIRLLLLEAAPEILRGVHPSLAKRAGKRLHKAGIEIRVGARVTRCSDGGVEISGNEQIAAATVVWAAGVRAHPLVEALPGPHDRIGRASVNAHLQLEGHPEVFVVGDSSAPLSAPDAPRVAPVAIEQGALAARNILAIEEGKPLSSYAYASKGTLVSLGMNHAVISVFGLNFGGYFAWLIWNAIHLFKLVGLKKQVQVALDWALGSIFPRDAAPIRRPRGCALCEKARQQAAQESRPGAD